MVEHQDLPSLKASMRKAVFAARKRAHAACAAAPELARDCFLASRLPTGAAVIAGYRPIRTELDPTPLMTALHRAGHRICVPVIKAPGQPLDFRAWSPGAEMIPGPFGAEIPADGAWLEPELLLVPLVAFDRAGWRLGYGGGFYDRTLERLRRGGRRRAIGMAYTAQEVDAVPREPTDQRLDAVLTEAGLIRMRAATY